MSIINKNRAIFLDRDGTIVSDYPDQDWSRVKELEYLDNALEGMKLLQEMGYKIIIVTNQYIINNGIITVEDYEKFNEKLLEKFELEGITITAVYYCPHTSEEKCNCKKPKVGMIHRALCDHPEIKLSESFIVGDSQCDFELARNVDMKFYGIIGGSLDSRLDSFNSIYEIAQVIEKQN